jgi:rhodanese-related sulfurtransferase
MTKAFFRKGIRCMLALAIFIVLVVCVWYVYETRWDRQLFQAKPGSLCQNLQAQEAKDWLRDHPETQVLDVRSADEFSRGALPQAIHLSLGDDSFEQKVLTLDSSKPVLVYCAGGYRSRKAVEKLKRLGFVNIQHLHRGYLSWRPEKLP